MSILARPPRAGPIGQAVLGVSLPLDRGRFCSSRPGSSLGSARRALPVRGRFRLVELEPPAPSGEELPPIPSAGPDRHRTAPLPRGCCVRRLATRRDNASNDKPSNE